MSRLVLSIMGPFQVTLDGKTVAGFESDRVRALLAYLAVESGRPHRRSALAGLLWPEWPEDSARTNLRNALANLRKVTGEREAAAPLISASREILEFNPGSEGWVDVITFQELTTPGQPLERLAEGVRLYRGPFLEGFGLKDSAAYEEWQGQVQERLQRGCLDALGRMGKAYEERGELNRALEAAWKQVDLAPWREEGHRRLMELQARSGQRSAALAQYETCRQVLQEELGVEPGVETNVLLERIRAGEFSVEREKSMPAAAQAGPTLAGSQTNLPVWLMPFIGRKNLLEHIRGRLQDPACRLLTLVGLGGSGKTRLAVEAAGGLAQVYPDGAYFVPLAGVQEIESIVPAIAQELGFSFSGQLEPRRQLLNFLRDKTLLLVLDNYEHLQKGAGIVREMLESAPRVKILVTSRVGLNLQGENLLPVAGMSVPQEPPEGSAEMLQYSSVKLFLEGARRVAPAFELAQPDLEQVARICRALGGMPLGILLAANWMRLLTPGEIAAEITAHSLDFLESEWADAPERQSSLRGVVEYSYRMLGERERGVFAALSVFRGGFSYPAARQVAGATLRDLVKLADHSLLERGSNGRYGLHEALRQFGAEKLGMLPNRGEEARDRHSAYYAAALRGWEEKLKSAQQRDALAEVQLELENIRAAWSWAVEQGQVDRLAEGVWGLYWIYDALELYQEGAAVFERALKRLDRLDLTRHPEGTVLRASLLTGLGALNSVGGKLLLIKEQIVESLELLEEAARAGQDVRCYQAFSLHVLAWVYVYFLDFDAARQALDAALALSRESNARWEMAFVLGGLGSLVQAQGDLGEAVGFWQQGLAIFQELGDERKEIAFTCSLAWSLSHLGQIEEAERLARDSVARSRDQGLQRTLGFGLGIQAETLVRAGKYLETLALLEECATIYHQMGDWSEQSRTMLRLGRANLGLGRYLAAEEALQSSLVLSRDAGKQSGIGFTASCLGDLALVKDDFAQARQWYRESVAAMGDNASRGRSVAGLAVAGLKMGDIPQARRFLGDGLRIALASQNFDNLLHILVDAVLFAVEEGRAERAVELYALASRHPYIANSVFFQDLAGKSIAALAATLPVEVAAAARAQGQARDLWATIEELAAEVED